MSPKVLSRIEDGVGYLTLNDPERRNAMTAELVEEALAAHAEFAAAGVRVGVVSAEGPVFSAGGDLKAKRIPGVPPAGVKLIEAFETSPLLWIAAVQGPALGAALHLISTCPRAIISEDAWLAIPEFPHGRFPRPIVLALAEVIGPRRAMRMAMTGEKIDAATALSLGLVERVVPERELQKHAAEEAIALCKLDPEALAVAREVWGTRLGLRESN